MSGVLLIAFVAAAGAGLFAADPGPAPPTTGSVDLEAAPDPVALSFPEPGAALTGAAPCPEPDGSSPRVTGFEVPPTGCLDTTAPLPVTLSTERGDIVVSVDPGLDPVAADLFVSFVRYHVYDGVPFAPVIEAGLLVGGEPFDPGLDVDVAATAPPSLPRDDTGATVYPVGSVALFADADGTLSSRFVLVTDELAGAALGADPVHPLVGQVVAGLEVARAIVDEAGSPSGLPVARIDLVTADAPEPA